MRIMAIGLALLCSTAVLAQDKPPPAGQAATPTKPKAAAAKPKPPAVKGVMDCRYIKEEDERLTCFNGFVEKLPKLPTQ